MKSHIDRMSETAVVYISELQLYKRRRTKETTFLEQDLFYGIVLLYPQFLMRSGTQVWFMNLDHAIRCD